jgi:hypothetical protein
MRRSYLRANPPRTASNNEPAPLGIAVLMIAGLSMLCWALVIAAIAGLRALT